MTRSIAGILLYPVHVIARTETLGNSPASLLPAGIAFSLLILGAVHFPLGDHPQLTAPWFAIAFARILLGAVSLTALWFILARASDELRHGDIDWGIAILHSLEMMFAIAGGLTILAAYVCLGIFGLFLAFDMAAEIVTSQSHLRYLLPLLICILSLSACYALRKRQ